MRAEKPGGPAPADCDVEHPAPPPARDGAQGLLLATVGEAVGVEDLDDLLGTPARRVVSTVPMSLLVTLGLLIRRSACATGTGCPMVLERLCGG